jgi:hypothetical protein
VFESNLLDFSDANPAFDGMRVYIQNDPLELDTANIGFNNDAIDINAQAVFPPSIGSPKEHNRADWEIRWNNTDTTATGEWASPGDTAKTGTNADVVCPFEIWQVNPTEERATYRINESIPALRNNGKWDWGEPIVLQPLGETGARTNYDAVFLLPPDSITTTPTLPQSGDIFFVRTTKPFQAGDQFLFETKSIGFESSAAKSNLNDIYVVPNPYVAYSLFEEPGRTSDKRGERELQFRNLPPQCTIRIYTITGDLVQTIHKNDNSSIARWDLLSFEGQRIAYGVYIYHVDAPGIGEKIGRIAVIK